MNPPKNPLVRNILFSLVIALSVFATWICVYVGSNQDIFFIEDAELENFRLCDEAGQEVLVPDVGFIRAETIELYVCGELTASDDVWIAIKWLLPGNDDWTIAVREGVYPPGEFQTVIYPFSADGFPVGTYPIAAFQEDVEMVRLEVTIAE